MGTPMERDSQLGTHVGERHGRVRVAVPVAEAVTNLVGVLWVLSELCSTHGPGCQKPSVSMILEDKSFNPLEPNVLLQGGEFSVQPREGTALL